MKASPLARNVNFASPDPVEHNMLIVEPTNT